VLAVDLAAEALRLAGVMVQLEPGRSEAYGLLALCELTAARFPARIGPDGEPVLLADQDRRRWDRSAIRRGMAALAMAESFGQGLGPYGLQAAIAACHATARSVEETDWERIVILYEALGRIAPSPIVELNCAVAVSMAHGPQQALPIVDDLVARDVLRGSQLLPSVRGELLIKLGRLDEARQELELAVRLTANSRERGVLERKIEQLSDDR
jgi:predicted RNA polymerase sigma factor